MIEEFGGVASPKTKRLRVLYGLIRKYGPISRATLIDETNYKPATCNRLIEELMEADLIVASGVGPSSGGRKPLLYTINPDYRYVIGIDMARSFSRVTLINLNLEMLHSIVVRMEPTYTSNFTLQMISAEIHKILDDFKVRNKLLGIGIGALGPINREEGVIHSHFYYTDDWEGVPIVDRFSKEFDTYVQLDTGANLAALGEYRKNYWRTTENFAFTLSGDVLQSGIVFQGQMIRSRAEMEDAFGHICVDATGRKCYCGSFGCLDTYAGFAAIREAILRRIKLGRPSILQEKAESGGNIHLGDIWEALDKNDPLCVEVIEEAAYYYGLGLSNLIFLANPEVVTIGGGLGQHPIFYEAAKKVAQERLQHYPRSEVTFSRPSSRFNDIATGAGCMIIDHFAL